jgi:hypothetical protein
MGHVAHMGEERKVYKILVGALGRPRCSWKDEIRMDLGERLAGGWGGGMVSVGQDRHQLRAVVNTVMKFWVLAPQN